MNSDPANKKYPHKFNNAEGVSGCPNVPLVLDSDSTFQLSFPLCAGESLTEFPLKKSGNYAGEAEKGADRVVYAKSSCRRTVPALAHP